MHLMCAWERALIRLSNVFILMGSEPCDGNVHEMCSETSVWLSAHLHAHARHSGHCMFTCNWCVLVNVQWSSCFMCSCNWAVSRMTDVCMKMCSEPIVWLSAYLHVHVRHSSNCTFTCTWCVLVNVQVSAVCCVRVIGHWDQWPMCASKMCSAPIVWLSAHLHAHVRHLGHCTFTCTWCVHVNVQSFDCLRCLCNWAVSPMTDVCMKMCIEPIVLLSRHLHGHLRHTGYCTFTCTWCVHVNVQWFDCLLCSCNWAVSPMADVRMKMCT